MDIELHIEHILLEGIPLEPSQRGVLHAAIEIELARLLQNATLSSESVQGYSVPLVRAGNLSMTDRDPQSLGGQIAEKIYRSANL